LNNNANDVARTPFHEPERGCVADQPQPVRKCCRLLSAQPRSVQGFNARIFRSILTRPSLHLGGDRETECGSFLFAPHLQWRPHLFENLTSSPKSVVIAAILRDRQTALTPPAFVRRLKPDLLLKSGRMAFRPRSKPSELWRLVLIIAALIGLITNGLAQEKPSEYEVKAAFLFNFAKFVEWPPDAFADSKAPIVIGVLGDNVFGNNLEKVINDRKVNNRGFQFRVFDSVTEATHCQILFISASKKNDFAKIVAALHNASVLTISETDGFLKAGGMINFLFEGNNVRFQISDEAAKKARLSISSKLLSLAVPAS
jgi:hypothetical protein